MNSKENPSKGFVVVASKKQNFYTYAINLIESIKDYYPEAQVCLVTENRFLDGRQDVADIVIECDDHYRAKLWGMSQTPWDITMYCDADMECEHEDISTVWDSLEDNDLVKAVASHANKLEAGLVKVCAQAEAELSELEEEERIEFLQDLGINEPGLDKLARATYDLLGLQTYFTAGEKEIRAWTIKKGFKAPQAAGVIHTDFERGFIKAEVYSIPDLINVGSEKGLKEAGKLRIEGKEYVVKDGDVMHFRFNV